MNSPGQHLRDAILREINLTLWALSDGRNSDFSAFFRDLQHYCTHYSVRQLAQDAGVNVNTFYGMFRGTKDSRLATVVRLLYHLRLRLRIEVDPTPRKAAAGPQDEAASPKRIDMGRKAAAAPPTPWRL